MHLILHNFKVSLSFCKVSEGFVSNCYGYRVRKKTQRNGLKMNKIFFNDTDEIFTDLNVSHVNKEWAIFFWFSFSITALGQIRRVIVFFVSSVVFV